MASLSESLVRQLLDNRYIASLATHNSDGSIHMVAVWYLFDGSNIYVATSSRSRKTRNIRSNSDVSVMIDSRDVAAYRGTTVAGTAQIITGRASLRWNARIHQKYLSEAALADPKVGRIFAAADDVTIQIAPTKVISWDMRQVDRQFFESAMLDNPSYLLPLET